MTFSSSFVFTGSVLLLLGGGVSALSFLTSTVRGDAFDALPSRSSLSKSCKCSPSSEASDVLGLYIFELDVLNSSSFPLVSFAPLLSFFFPALDDSEEPVRRNSRPNEENDPSDSLDLDRSLLLVELSLSLG